MASSNWGAVLNARGAARAATRRRVRCSIAVIIYNAVMRVTPARDVSHKNGSFVVSTAAELKSFGSGLVERSKKTILIAGKGSMHSGRVWNVFCSTGCAC